MSSDSPPTTARQRLDAAHEAECREAAEAYLREQDAAMATTPEIAYALTRWPDTRGESITREAAAQIAEEWAVEGPHLPIAASAGWHDGWAAACEAIAMALRFKDFHL